MIEYDLGTGRWSIKREDSWCDEVERWIVQELKQSLEQSTPTYGEIKARQEGREEVWEMVRKVMLSRADVKDAYTCDQVYAAFGVNNVTHVLRMPLNEALNINEKLQKKIEEEKEKKKLHVGDEVEFVSMFDRLISPDDKDSNLRKGYVIDAEVDGCPECVRVLLKRDGTRVVSINTCKKTGKHNPDLVKAMNALNK